MTPAQARRTLDAILNDMDRSDAYARRQARRIRELLAVMQKKVVSNSPNLAHKETGPEVGPPTNAGERND